MPSITEQSQADLNKEKLRKSQTDIEVVTTAKISNRLPQIIKSDIEIPFIRSGILYKNGVTEAAKDYSKPADPAIILVNGAGPCTLLVAHDTDGSTMIVHTTHYLSLGEAPEEKDIARNDEALEDLRQFRKGLSSESRVLITATNVRPSIRNEIVADIVDKLALDVDLVTQVFLDSEPLLDQPDPEIGLTKDLISAIMFVPKELSADSRNKIFIISDTEEDLLLESTAAWHMRNSV